MKITKFVFNPFQQNTFVVQINNSAIIIDAGCQTELEQKQIYNHIKDNGLKVEKILLTHMHFDHILGCNFLKESFPDADICASVDYKDLYSKIDSMSAVFGMECDDQPEPNVILKHNDEIVFQDSVIKVIHVPGHSPCGLAFYFEKQKVVFTGDILFQQSIGRTDFPYGSHETLISGIKKHIVTLPESTTVYCGHGPETTIGSEKTSNSFLF